MRSSFPLIKCILKTRITILNLQKIKMQISKSIDRFLDFAEDKKKEKDDNYEK